MVNCFCPDYLSPFDWGSGWQGNTRWEYLVIMDSDLFWHCIPTPMRLKGRRNHTWHYKGMEFWFLHIFFFSHFFNYISSVFWSDQVKKQPSFSLLLKLLNVTRYTVCTAHYHNPGSGLRPVVTILSIIILNCILIINNFLIQNYKLTPSLASSDHNLVVSKMYYDKFEGFW